MEFDLGQTAALPRDRRRAVVLAVVLALFAAAVLPFAQRPAGSESLQLMAIVITLAFAAVSVTGLLLWAQSRIARGYAMAVLALGYGLTAATMIPYLLFYRGFWPQFVRLAGAAPQTSAWFGVEWHLTFTLGAVAYFVLRRFGSAPAAPGALHHGRRRLLQAGAVILAITVPPLIWMHALPDLRRDAASTVPSAVTAAAIASSAALAIVLAYAFGRFRYALDLWLSVACFSMILDVLLSGVAQTPFTVGWYASRLGILVGSLAVATVLLFQVARMYAGLARTAKKFEDESRRDALTGTVNRRGFDEDLERMLGRADHEADPVALALVDVDHFKAVNDTFGHQTGDGVLISIARELKRVVARHGDVVARYGGDEFALILEGSTLAGALTVAQRARAAVGALRIPSPVGGFLTLSIGVTLSLPTDDAVTLMQRADIALYRAKASGRNAVVADHPAPAPTEVRPAAVG